VNDALLPARQDRTERLTRERCYVTELLNDPGVPQTSLARCRVSPGITTELHRLTVDEWYVVASGLGEMQVGADPSFAVGPGDTVAIPAGVAQRIRNSGNDDLVFQCICVPRFEPQCYESLEND
jgi:mannose-6-phosphate isomerase-like protein (cupin superfamily)